MRRRMWESPTDLEQARHALIGPRVDITSTRLCFRLGQARWLASRRVYPPPAFARTYMRALLEAGVVPAEWAGLTRPYWARTSKFGTAPAAVVDAEVDSWFAMDRTPQWGDLAFAFPEPLEVADHSR